MFYLVTLHSLIQRKGQRVQNQPQTSLRLISVSLSNVLYCIYCIYDVSVVSRFNLYLNKILFTLTTPPLINHQCYRFLSNHWFWYPGTSQSYQLCHHQPASFAGGLMMVHFLVVFGSLDPLPSWIKKRCQRSSLSGSAHDLCSYECICSHQIHTETWHIQG